MVHLLGIDAGVKSGVSTIMGLRSAGQIASGAGHTLGHIAGKGISKAGGAVAGSIGGAISGGINGAKAQWQILKIVTIKPKKECVVLSVLLAELSQAVSAVW